jgi:hypothetical protein
MTMTIDRNTRPSGAVSPAKRLQASFAAARVSFTWLGVRKSLSADQRAQAAESFGAEGAFLSAGKKLLDTRDEKFRAVTAVRNRIQGYWKNLSLPYPEPGLRLIRHQDVEPFTQQMGQFKAELDAAVLELDRHFADLQSAARDRLGSLYNSADYPAALSGLFDVAWDFPSVEPPEYLMRLNPQLYELERERIATRFDEAVQLAEQAFTAEFAKLVSHLVERLAGGMDGEKKVFRDSAIGNLTDFVQRFRSLNIHSSAELDQLVETAQRTIQGIEPQAVRDSDSLRQHVGTQFSAIQAALDGMLVDQPRRRILRPGKEGTA